MNKTIQAIALSAAFLSSAAMANSQGTHVNVDTGLQSTLQILSQHVKNGSALNLAINTSNIDATVNTHSGFNSMNNVGDKIAVETSAIGAVNTGSINLQQGSLSAVNTGSFTAGLHAGGNAWEEAESHRSPDYSSGIEGHISANVNTSYYDRFSETMSNYSAANLAFNSGVIDASVNTEAFKNHIDGIKTSAIGAVNTGSITVTVK